MANKGLTGNYGIPDPIKHKLDADIKKGLGGKNRRRIIGYVKSGHLTDREIAKLVYDYKYNNLGPQQDIDVIERLIKWAAKEIGGKTEHIERTKTSQSDIGIENKHKKTHFKFGDDTKPIQFKNLVSVPKAEKMFESLEVQQTNMKTKQDLLNALQSANPKGFVLVIGPDGKGGMVNNPANLNVHSFGYKNSEGVDITDGKVDNQFIGLPDHLLGGMDIYENKYNRDMELRDVSPGSLNRSRSKVYNVSEFIKALNSFPDDAILVSFDGALISEIKFNGTENVYVLDDWNNRHYQRNPKPNDFVVLVKGEQLNRFFRPERKTEKINEEIKRAKELMK